MISPDTRWPSLRQTRRAADRILAREDLARQSLVDDEDRLCLLGVGRAREASTKEWNPHRLEVVTTDHADHGRPLVLGTRDRTPFDLETVSRTNAAHGQVVGRADGAHPWQVLDALQQVTAECPDTVIRVVPGRGQRGAEREHLLRLESGIHSTQRPEAAAEQTGTREEHQRERHLRHDEDASEAVPAATGRRTARRVLERRLRRRSGGLDRGGEAEEHGAEEGHDEGEGQDPQVHADLSDPGEIEARGNHGDEESGSPRGEHHAKRASGPGEHEALRQELAHQPSPSGTEREPDRQLRAPCRGAAEHQARDIGAGNEQEDAHGPEEHEQRQAHILHRGFQERHHLHAPVTTVRGKGGFNPPGDQGELRARLLGRDVGSQAPHDIENAPHAGPIVRNEGERHPELSARLGQFEGADGEAVRHHADDREGFLVQRDRLANDPWIASVSPLPEPVAQDHFGLHVAQAGSNGKRAAQEGRGAEHGEEVRCHAIRPNLEWLAPTGQVRAHVLPSGHVLEGSALEAPVVEIRRRDAGMRRGPDHRESVRFHEAQGPQQDRIHDGEDRRAPTDSQGECGDGDRAETRRASQQTQRVADVLP